MDFFSKLPDIVDDGLRKTTKFPCDVCPLQFDSEEILNNHRTMFCNVNYVMPSMKETKTLWMKLTLALSKRLSIDFFVDFITELMNETKSHGKTLDTLKSSIRDLSSENNLTKMEEKYAETNRKRKRGRPKDSKVIKRLKKLKKLEDKNNEKTSHSCLLCDRIFLSYENIRLHITNNHENGTYKCSMCNAGFSYISDFKNHIAKEHGGRFQENKGCPYGSKISGISDDQMKLQADVMLTSKNYVHKLIPEQSKLLDIDSGLQNLLKANMLTPRTDVESFELGPNSPQELKQNNEHIKVPDIISGNEKHKFQDFSTDLSTSFSVSKMKVNSNLPHSSAEKSKELNKNILLDNTEEENITNDSSRILEMPNDFYIDHENIVEEESMNKSEKINVINSTHKQTLSSKIERKPTHSAANIIYEKLYEKYGLSIKSEDTNQKDKENESSDPTNISSHKISTELESRMHIVSFHEGKLKNSHECYYCNTFYSSKTNLKRHQRGNCSKSVTPSDEQLATLVELKCSRCKFKSFSTQYELDEHISLLHEGKSNNRLECDRCHNFYPTKSNLNKHKLRHCSASKSITTTNSFGNKIESREVLYDSISEKSSHAGSDSGRKEIHEEVRVKTETKPADSLFDFDLSENLANSERQFKAEEKEKLLRKYSEKLKELTVIAETHKHTSACYFSYASKWANQNSNLCPVKSRNELAKKIDELTTDELLNNPKNDLIENNEQTMLKISEKVAIVNLEEKSVEINKKYCETNENESETFTTDFSTTFSISDVEVENDMPHFSLDNPEKLDKNVVLNDVKEENNTDALDDMSSILEMPNDFSIEQQNENVVEEKSIIKSEEFNVINHTHKHTLPSKIESKPIHSAAKNNDFYDKYGLSIKSEDTNQKDKKNESSDPTNISSHKISTELESEKHNASFHEGKLKNSYECYYCNTFYSSKSNLKKHQIRSCTQTVTPSDKQLAALFELKCPRCKFKSFSTQSELDKHIKLVHEGKSNNSFQCDKCHNFYSSKSNLNKHIVKHCSPVSKSTIIKLFGNQIETREVLDEEKSSHTESDSDGKEIHEEVSVKTETKHADSLLSFDLSENLENSEEQVKVEEKEKAMKKYSEKLAELTAIAETHKHTSACYASKWANQNSNSCPVKRRNELSKQIDEITTDELLNKPPKKPIENSEQIIPKIDKKASIVKLKEKSEEIKKKSNPKNCETNENESESFLKHEEPLLNSQKYSIFDIDEKENNETLENQEIVIENRNFECEYCFKTFGKFHILKRHLLLKRCMNYPIPMPSKRCSKRLGSAETLHQCPECRLSFSKESHLIHHQKEEHKIIKERKDIRKRYKCKYCDGTFAFRTGIKRHLESFCTADPDRFELIPQMRIKSLGKKGKTQLYQCKYCPMTFATRSGTRKHLQTICTSDPDRFDLISKMRIAGSQIPKFHCKKCDKTYTSDFGYRHHMATVHEGKRHDCSICGKKFKTKQIVERHISYVHEGKKKPYLCSLCGVACANKGSLNLHIECVHEGLRKHQCDQCDKKFSKRPQLKQHISSVHEKKRPFKCTICSRSYTSKEGLVQHADVHTNIRPYSCTICEDKFKRSHHLVTHLKTIHNIAKNDWKLDSL